MCGRFTLRTPAEALSSLFDEINFPKLTPRYNIAPTQQVLAVRESADATKEAVTLRWGLVPFWAKDLKIGARMINARSETAASKPAFRAAFKKRRCLVLADGFFEWKKIGKEKQPFYVTRTDNRPFCMAGLWESWSERPDDVEQNDTEKNDVGENSDMVIETCTVLTTSANSTMEKLHDRMPVILPPEQYDFWLDREFSDQKKLEQLLVPCAADLLEMKAVNKIVNKVANDRPQCIEAADAQQSLF